MPISALAANSPSAPSVRAARAGQQTGDSAESFQPVWNHATKSAITKDDAADAGSPGNAKPKSVKSPDPAVKKSDPTPVVAATDQPVEEPLVLKTAEAPAEPRQVSPPAVPPPVIVEPFLLPEPVPAAASDSASGSTSTPAPAAAPTDNSQTDAQAPADPGTLVFQLSLNPSDAASKAPPENKDNQAETPAFSLSGETAIPSQTHASGSNSQAKNQDQQDQEQAPLPQPLPAGTNGTIASQFGFQPPLSFAAQVTVAKTEAVAPTRTMENVSTPELPAAPAVDRISLTIRGANDEVVRVAVNQSGELVQVGVNTSNADLASELRGSVPELMHRLDQQGYDSKVSIPTSTLAAQAPVATAHSEFRSGADSNGNSKSNGNFTMQDEPKQQRQRNNQRAWRELASQLQED